MRKTLTSLALAAAIAPAALAQFEGVVEMKMQSPGGAGTMTGMVSKAGSRMEMNVGISGEAAASMGSNAVKMVMLTKASNPDVVYMINDERRVYSEMNVKEMAARAKDLAGTKDSESWTVKKLGTDRVAGTSCQNALVTSSNGTESEMCVATDMMGMSQLAARMNRGRGEDGLYKALKDQGLDGFPIRIVMKAKGKEQVRWELVKAERKSLPASTFEIPAGYQKDESIGGMGAAMPAGAAKAMEDALKNMTPEQRKQFEEMMKKMGNKKQ